MTDRKNQPVVRPGTPQDRRRAGEAAPSSAPTATPDQDLGASTSPEVEPRWLCRAAAAAAGRRGRRRRVEYALRLVGGVPPRAPTPPSLRSQRFLPSASR